MPFYMRPNDDSHVPNIVIVLSVVPRPEKRPVQTDQAEWSFGYACLQRFDLVKGSWTDPDRFSTGTPGEVWTWIYKQCGKKKCPWVFVHDARTALTLSKWWHELDTGRTRVNGDAYTNPTTGRERKGFRGMLCLEDQPAFAKVMSSKGRYNLVDLRNYFPGTISTLANDFAWSIRSFEDSEGNHADYLADCRDRCDLVAHVVRELLDFWRGRECGVFQMTAGSLAMHSWRHEFLGKVGIEKGIYVLLDKDGARNEWERQGLLGARIEPFWYGEIGIRPPGVGGPPRRTPGPKEVVPAGPIWQMDLCSFYPWIMANWKYPCRRVAYERSPDLRRMENRLLVDGCMAFVRLDTRRRSYPLKTPKGTINALGSFDAWLCGDELRDAVAGGDIAKVHECRWYAMADLFGDWVRMWFQRRKTAREEGNQSFDRFAALMLRSLFGKWSQRGRTWKNADDVFPPERWFTWHQRDRKTGNVTRMRSIAGIVQKLEMGEDPEHVFPAISAFITANARQVIHQLLRDMPPHTVLYVNTDALWVTDAGKQWLEANHLCDEFDLGKFRVKGRYDWIRLSGVNDIETAASLVRAGLPDQWRTQTASGWEGWQTEGMAALIGRGPAEDVRFQRVRFQDHSDAWKNTIGEDGWAKPRLILQDWT